MHFQLKHGIIRLQHRRNYFTLVKKIVAILQKIKLKPLLNIVKSIKSSSNLK